jgi:hypothetical protein
LVYQGKNDLIKGISKQKQTNVMAFILEGRLNASFPILGARQICLFSLFLFNFTIRFFAMQESNLKKLKAHRPEGRNTTISIHTVYGWIHFINTCSHKLPRTNNIY